GSVPVYQALAVGPLWINAPVTAVPAAALPVIFSVFFQGLPGQIQVAGFTLALIAVWLISRPERARGRPAGVGLALLAGLGFGSFFILISRASSTAIFWPLAAARLASFLFMLSLLLIRRQDLLPKFSAFPLVLLAGTLDVAGNAFFVLATHSGRLAVAAIFPSLYPGATVLLAGIILRERVTG